MIEKYLGNVLIGILKINFQILTIKLTAKTMPNEEFFLI